MDRDDMKKSGETTVDLSSVMVVDRTEHYDSTEAARLQGQHLSAAIEANIILIAHPEDELLGTRFRLPPSGTLEIGRSSATDISLPNVRSLSRLHARLCHVGDRVEIRDLGSTNGTYVNDQAVDGSRQLRSGDRFQVGAVHFKFLHELDPEHAYHEAIYQLVMHDGLTQAFNKHKFDEELNREFGRAKRHLRPLTLAMFDIDHFKDVNDSHGHLCGDFVLQQIARMTEKYLRPEQVFGRIGGEEFGILNPEMDELGAFEMAEKLRARIAKTAFDYADVAVQTTCSFGIALLTSEMTVPHQLYEAADRALYASKKNGRNRVTRFDPTVVQPF